MDLETAKQAVVAVGGGRGFVIDTEPRLIVTAAHCLPELPPAMSFSDLAERTYENLVGRIGEDRQEIWAECLFADPIADIAVLGAPDGQELFDEHGAFETFLECGRYPPPSLPMQPPHEEKAWLLGLGGEWEPCRIQTNRFGALGITEALKGIVAGMSGSPIMNTSSEAVGVVSMSGGPDDNPHIKGGPQASLWYNLPIWVFLLTPEKKSPPAKPKTKADK